MEINQGIQQSRGEEGAHIWFSRLKSFKTCQAGGSSMEINQGIQQSRGEEGAHIWFSRLKSFKTCQADGRPLPERLGGPPRRIGQLRRRVGRHCDGHPASVLPAQEPGGDASKLAAAEL
uniref:Uncharacterized protein n=1 Tax=Oryza meridionalis TaxID=40149 RepID=A0A0E0E4N4_9ORYZ